MRTPRRPGQETLRAELASETSSWLMWGFRRRTGSECNIVGATPAVEGRKVEGRTVPGALEVAGSHHHGGGAQGVAGASEVVPFDAVELPDVVAHRVINAVEVGEAAGIEPPT